MYKHCINMKQEQKIAVASRWGNSAGVAVPRAWLGREVKVTLIDRSSQIRKEIFDMLKDYMEDIMGIYLVGSYARGDQTRESDIDIIAISKDLKKEIVSGKYHVSIYPRESVEKTLIDNPMMIYPRLIEAKSLFNKSFLEDLDLTFKENHFGGFVKDTKGIIKINRKILELDKLEGDKLTSVDVIYSIVLRLRGMFILRCLVGGKNYSLKSFKAWIEKEIKGIDFKKIYGAYGAIKMDKKLSEKFKVDEIEKVLVLLEKEVKNYG